MDIIAQYLITGLEFKPIRAKPLQRPSESQEKQISDLIALYDQNQFEQVLEAGSQLLSSFPDEIIPYKVMAASNIKLGRLQQAVRLYESVLSLKPDDATTYVNMGAALNSLGMLDESIASYEKAVEINPGDLEAIKSLSNVQRTAGRIDQAIASLTKLQELRPNDASVHYELGMTLLMSGNKDAAEECLRKAVDIAPEHGPSLCALGIVQKELGDLEAASVSLSKAVEIEPGNAEAHNNLGTVKVMLDEADEAQQHFQKAVELAPDYFIAHNNLGNIHKAKGEHELAIKSYSKSIELNPEFAEACNNLVSSLQALGQYKEAEQALTKALEFHPEDPKIHNNLGMARHNLGKLELAMASYEKAIELDPGLVKAHTNIATTLLELGKPEEAHAHIAKALEIDPNDAANHNERGVFFAQTGDKDSAIASFGEAVRLDPAFSKAHYNLSQIKDYKAGDPEIAQMESLYKESAGNSRDRMHYCFALAEALDDTDTTDRAFAYLEEGNRIRKSQLKYDIADDRKFFAGIRKQFAESMPVTVQPAEGTDSKDLIFIVGMPRSGTSLAEQIISSHSSVQGAGELPLLWTASMEAFSASANGGNGPLLSGIEKIREFYLAGLRKRNISMDVVTDKMPMNFLCIGYIALAFPDAKIVNLVRDPRAVCWSIYRLMFPQHGLGYAYDLEDVAEYYNLYKDLMDFWREKFPGKIHDLNYEALTENQEEETRKLIAYCGLDWEDACLDFEKNTRSVNTASQMQVREKIYQGSSEAWRKYEAYLGPMLKKLEA